MTLLVTEENLLLNLLLSRHRSLRLADDHLYPYSPDLKINRGRLISGDKH